jgi:fructoselysine 3-epimerase
MVSLAFSTNAFTRFSLVPALERIRAAGFGAVEILADVPHAYPGLLNRALISDIASNVERLGLQVSNINANCSSGFFRDGPPEAFFEPSLISPRPEWRVERVRMIGRAMELARAVGSANLSITTGRLLGGIPPKVADELLREGLGRVLKMADQYGVNVGIECEPGLYLEYATELKEWIDRMGHPRLGANLDVGHSQVIGEDIPTTIRLLRGRIWNLHVEDIPGRKHYHLVPGDGTMDWGALATVLRETGYDRYATVEVYTQTEAPDEAARRSFAFLTRTLGRDGN